MFSFSLATIKVLKKLVKKYATAAKNFAHFLYQGTAVDTAMMSLPGSAPVLDVMDIC